MVALNSNRDLNYILFQRERERGKCVREKGTDKSENKKNRIVCACMYICMREEVLK